MASALTQVLKVGWGHVGLQLSLHEACDLRSMGWSDAKYRSAAVKIPKQWELPATMAEAEEGVALSPLFLLSSQHLEYIEQM